MPQTREQLALARKAGIAVLVVFLNKLDAASDRETVDPVELEIRELANVYGYLGNRLPVIRGSAALAIENPTGHGRSAILDLLATLDAAVPSRHS
jgi:elongation factor Tu